VHKCMLLHSIFSHKPFLFLTRLQPTAGMIKNINEIASERSIKWNPDEEDLRKRSYYSIQSIIILGRCLCSGHASKCKESGDDVGIGDDEKLPQCECQDNTCGRHCDKCCPLFNQRPFRYGTPQEENRCEKCECHGNAMECEYSEEVDRKGLSLSARGKFSGGGVCVNCAKNTTGVNCEKCLPNFYRPSGLAANADVPCLPCSCDTRGIVSGSDCDEPCQCKAHVTGQRCDKCLEGHFGLSHDNVEGCLKCYCSGISTRCTSHAVESQSVETLEGWTVTDISKVHKAYPTRDNETNFMVFGMYELPDVDTVYWSAPQLYLGNKLESYGSHFTVDMNWVIVRGDVSGKPTNGPNFVMIGRNGMKIAFGDGIFENSNATFDFVLKEDGWYHIPKSVKDIVKRLRRTEYRGDPVTRTQFMSVLINLDSVLIRGTYHSDQAEGILKRVTMLAGEARNSNEIIKNIEELRRESFVEKCECPAGYSGLSCEICAFGYIAVYENSSNHETITKCHKCDCNGHAASCDLVRNKCGECLFNTHGDK